MKKQHKADIVISGAGLTGALAALLLKKRCPQLNILMLDDGGGAKKNDPRGIALALRTWQVLQEAGVWNDDLASASQAIEHIHVSEQGAAGSCEMHAADGGQPALGCVVMAGALQAALTEACEKADVETISVAEKSNGTISSSVSDHALRTLKLADGTSIQTRLLVVAEGSQSPTRQLLGISVRESDYPQVAIAGKVQHSQSHQNWAYERFTRNGPAALLPQQPKQSALVWCVAPEQAEALQHATEAEFTRAVQLMFPSKIGYLESARYGGQFPLKLMLAERYVAARAVIIGNACHTLHPVAGQGYNLGVRDVLVLAEKINRQLAVNGDPGDIDILNEYAQCREPDYQQVSGLTDGLVRVFSNQNPVFRLPRQAGLMAMRTCPVFAKPLMRKAMGFRTAL